MLIDKRLGGYKMSVFSERVSLLLSKNKLSQKELAMMAKVTESAMSYYINGERTPRGEILTRMAKALDCSTDYLLGNSTENNNKPLQYLQRNLGKLDANQLKKAENILKAAFEDIFNDDEG